MNRMNRAGDGVSSGGVIGVTVPGHITGFFAAQRHNEPLKAGSIGCGLNLELSATIRAQLASGLADTEIKINGLASPAPVTRYVVERLAPAPVRISTDLQMMMGAGFGASGAGALGSALALNALFRLALTSSQAAAVAHTAEVAQGTGLGDVAAQHRGGLVIRLRPGAPGVGVVDQIPVSPIPVYCVVRGPIDTSEILSHPGTMRSVNRSGKECLKELMGRPTLEGFMDLSRRFSTESGLARPWMEDAFQAVEAVGGKAAMIMLGDAVFALGSRYCPVALGEFGPVIVTKVDLRGARLD